MAWSALPASAGLLAQLETEVQKLAADLSPSVVTVRAVRTTSSGHEAREVYVGTGVVFEPGWVVTTPSVVASGVKYSVQSFNDIPVPAELVGFDLDAEVAVFRVPTLDAPPARFRPDSVLLPGQVILTLGNAFGVQNAVSWGIAAGVQDDGNWQIGVNVAPGTSGSPVINSRGEVIGMVVAALSDRGPGQPGFGGTVASVVSSGRFYPLALQIKEHGFVGRAFLGIRPETVDPMLARALDLSDGVLVGAVSFGSPAYRAGLRVGDVIIRMGDSPMRNERDLRSLLSARCPGEEVELELIRNRNLNRVNVELGQAPDVLPEQPWVQPRLEPRKALPPFESTVDTNAVRQEIQDLEERLDALKRQFDSP